MATNLFDSLATSKPVNDLHQAEEFVSHDMVGTEVISQSLCPPCLYTFTVICLVCIVNYFIS